MLKKTYETPIAEKIEFQYEEQVVASACTNVWVNIGDGSCTEDNSHFEKLN